MLLTDGATTREGQILFRFEKDMHFGSAERRLLSQLAIEVGYPLHGFPELEGQPELGRAEQHPQFWRYLTGETRAMLDDYPELEAMRDLVFYLKAFCAPDRDDLPA